MNKNKKIIIISLFVISTLLIFTSSFFLPPGGFVHRETKHRLLYYLDQRTFLEKIFDPVRNEIGGLYMGREVVIIFDIFDAYFIKLSTFFGFPHFFALTHYLSLILIIFLMVYISYKHYDKKNLIIPFLLGIIFLTTPANYFPNYFMRTSKTMVSLFLAVLITLIIKNIFEKKYSKLSLMSIFITTSLLALVDKPGQFLLLWFMGLFIVVYIFTKYRYYLYLSAFCFISFIIANIFNYYLDPLLIKYFADYQPDFSYQNLDLATTLKQPKVFVLGYFFFLDNFYYMWGNLGRIAGSFILLIFYFLFNLSLNAYKKVLDIKKIIMLNFLLLSSIILIAIFNALQIWRHSPILLEDVKRLYYEKPILTLVLFFSSFILIKSLLVYPKIKIPLVILLVIICVLNIFSIPFHYQMIKNGYLNSEYNSSPIITQCVKEKNRLKSFYKLLPADREFCQRLKQVIYYATQ